MTEQTNGQNTKTEKKSTFRAVLETFNKVSDKIPEGPLWAHFVPGGMTLNKIVSWAIITAVAVPVAALVLGAAHSWLNSSYDDDYKDVLEKISVDSAKFCSLGQDGRKTSVYNSVATSIRDSGEVSMFSTLSWVPYAKYLTGEFRFLPNKKVYDALTTADKNHIHFYKAGMASGFSNDVRAVIFNDGTGAEPVLVYRNIGDGALPAIMGEVARHGLPQGNLALVWSDIRKAYDVETVAPGAETLPVKGGLEDAKLPVNACLVDNSLTGRTGRAIGNAVDGTTETIKDGASSVTDKVKHGADSVGGAVKDGAHAVGGFFKKLNPFN